MNEFFLYNEITADTLTKIKDYLNEKVSPVIHINSGGGEIFPAIAAATLIQKKGNVTVEIEGVCASAATVIAAAAKTVKASKNALLMLHLPSVLLMDMFNILELSKVQNALTAIQESIITTYKNRLKSSDEEILNMLAAETWLNAEEAQKLGLVDEIIEVKRMENNIMMEHYKNSVLEAERGRVNELNSALTDNEYVNALVAIAIKTGKSLADVRDYIDAVAKVTPKVNVVEAVIDNLKSGAEEVQGSTPTTTNTNADLLVKFMNEMVNETAVKK